MGGEEGSCFVSQYLTDARVQYGPVHCILCAGPFQSVMVLVTGSNRNCQVSDQSSTKEASRTSLEASEPLAFAFRRVKHSSRNQVWTSRYIQISNVQSPSSLAVKRFSNLATDSIKGDFRVGFTHSCLKRSSAQRPALLYPKIFE